MLHPSVDKLLEKVGSKYALVIATSKRARELKNGDDLLITNPKSHKFVGRALEELDADQMTIEFK